MTKKSPSNTHSYAQAEHTKFIAPYVSIDTVEFNVHGLKLNLPTKSIRTYDQDKQCITKQSARYRVNGAEGGDAILRSHNLVLSGDASTNISVSVPKFLTGQNVWGPGTLKQHLAEVMARILNAVKKYSDMPSKCNLDSVRTSSIALRRVDLFCCYCLKRADQVTPFMRHIHTLLATRRRGHLTKFAGRYVRWNSSKSRGGWSIVFYDKSREVSDNMPIAQESVGRKGLGMPEGTIKVELRLGPDELKKLKLSELNKWDEDTSRKLFERYVGEVLESASMQIPTMPISRQTLRKLPSALRPPFAIASLGIGLGAIYSRQSVQRYEKLFADRGIAVLAGTKARTIRVTRLLSPDRAFKKEQLSKQYRKSLDFAMAQIVERKRRNKKLKSSHPQHIGPL